MHVILIYVKLYICTSDRLFFHFGVSSKNTTGRDKLKKGGSDVPEKAKKAFLGNRWATLRRFRSIVIYFDSRRSFNPDLRSLMRRKRRSSESRNFSGHQMSRATVKSSFRRAFTHPSPSTPAISTAAARARIRASLRAARLLQMQMRKVGSWLRRVTTSLTAASHEDGPFLTAGCFAAAITPRHGARRWHRIRPENTNSYITSRYIETAAGTTAFQLRTIRNVYNFGPLCATLEIDWL